MAVDRSSWPFAADYVGDEWGEARWDFLVRAYQNLGNTAAAIGAALEVGIGGNPDGKALWSRRYHYTATDPDPHSLANDHYPAEDLPYGGDNFVVVVATELLEHVKSPSRAIWQFHRVLKPGGHLLMSIPFMIIGEHDCYWRYTTAGLQLLLAGTGPDGKMPPIQWSNIEITGIGQAPCADPNLECYPRYLGHLVHAVK